MKLAYGGKTYPVPASGLIVGSGPGCDVVLPGIAPRHAMVRRLGEHMGSVQRLAPGAVLAVNGTAVGLEPSPLLDGDRVRVGPYELEVRYPEPVAGGSRADPGPSHPVSPPPGARARLHDTLFGLPPDTLRPGESTPPTRSPGSALPRPSPAAAHHHRVWIAAAALFSLALIAYLLLR